MANFGSFEYGTSVVYGPVLSGSAIQSVDVLDNNKIIITFTDPVIVNEALLNPDNYTIEFSDNLGFTDVLPIEVYAGGTRNDNIDQTQTNTVTTTVVELITDYHTPGQGYRITVDNIVATDGSGVTPDPVAVTARRTKVETILRSLPAHWNHRQNGIMRSMLTAIGLEDDRIGGSLEEEIP